MPVKDIPEEPLLGHLPLPPKANAADCTSYVLCHMACTFPVRHTSYGNILCWISYGLIRIVIRTPCITNITSHAASHRLHIMRHGA